MLVWGLVFLGLAWSSYSGGHARRSGQTLEFGVYVAIFTVAMAVNLYLSFRARQFLRTLNAWLYKSEGHVTVSSPACRERAPLAQRLVPLLFGACVLGQVALDSYIPVRYQQPASALYVVPFLLYLVGSGKSVGGLSVILWPVLYAVHAVLLLAGAPILFEGQWQVLNLLIPVAGYGAFSFLAAHLYSRVTLRRLKQLG